MKNEVVIVFMVLGIGSNVSVFRCFRILILVCKTKLHQPESESNTYFGGFL
jgi:hypothetical protein